MSELLLDPSLISALSQKIESDFKSGADPRRKSAKSKKNNEKSVADLAQLPVPDKQSGKGQKRKREDIRKTSGGQKMPGTNGKTLRRHDPPDVASEASPPKKARKDDPRRAGPAKKEKTSKKGGNDAGVDLRNIIAELGGGDDDMELVEGAGSESELEGQEDPEQSAALRKDIQSMIKSLGLPQVQPTGGDTSEEEDQLDGEEDEDSSSDADDAAEDSGEADGESDLDDFEKPQLITQVKQALEKLPERKKTNRNGLVIDPQSEWHSIPTPGIAVSDAGGSQLHPETLEMLHDHAKELLKQENEKYAATKKTSSSANQFYSTIMASGTLSDKISALTLSAQESPLHNVQTLESLVNLAKKRNRGQAIEVLGALKDLLGPGSLLPSDRRLRNFATQPALKFVNAKEAKTWHSQKPLPRPLSETHLIIWAFEDWLKSTYFEILKVLESWLNDEIAYTRSKALGFIFELLRDKPEQEANLLRLLVNKLGDTDKQIASKTSYQILQIENAHPAMKPLIISSLESDLIFRPHQSNHAKYYGIITINQTVLSAREEQVARQLLDIYFSLFIELLNKPKPSAEPAAKIRQINSKGDSQGGGSAPGKKASKKAAALARSAVAEDELREKMLSAVLTGVNRAMPYVDKASDFFEKHLDTLFRVTHSANFNTSIQALMLIQQLSGSHQAASNRFYRTLYESLLDPRLLNSSKQALYLNLLYRALRADLSVKRVQAFVKRLLQVTAMQQPSFACAVIYLVRELEGVFPSLTTFVDQTEEDDSDGEEVFLDMPEELEDGESPNSGELGKKGSETKRQLYDGRKRDPEHANADASCLWELAPLRQHFHPSVSLFASSLSNHDKMLSKPDLSLNTLIHFLDKFVYRNPKKTTSGLRGHSLMQPLAGSGDTSSLLVATRDRKSGITVPVNTEGFRSKKGDAVEADEVFFHRYFNEINKKPEKAKKRKEDKARDDEDDVSGPEDEDEIWQALVDSRPEIEGEEGGEDDWDDMEDFEKAMQDGDDDEDVGDVVVDQDEIAEDLDEDLDEDENEEDGGLDFGDDEDDLLGSDDELPDGFAVASEKEPEKQEDDAAADTKRKKNSERRKMLKSLPMFASADDYAAMLADEDEG